MGGYPITPFVVGPVGQAGYQTIQAAVNAANSAGGGMVYIQTGTYNENLTLFDKIALLGDGEQNTFIVGTHIPPTSGTLNINKVTLQGTSAIIQSAAAGTTTIIVEDSTINVTNGHAFDLLNWTGAVGVFDIGNGGTNDGFINNTGGASFFAFSTGMGNGSGQSMILSGSVFITTADIECPIDFQTGATGTMATSIILSPITLSNNSAISFFECSITSGSVAAITMSSSGNSNFNIYGGAISEEVPVILSRDGTTFIQKNRDYPLAKDGTSNVHRVTRTGTDTDCEVFAQYCVRRV